jgi:hypothetical protein
MSEHNKAVNENLKRCPICKKEKTKDCFPKAKSNKDGLYSYCKECNSIRRKKEYYADIEKAKRKSLKYYYDNQEKVLKQCAEYREKNRDEIYQRDKKRNDNFLKFKSSLVCECCGYNKCSAALDFHHKDPNEKDINVGRLRKSTMERILQEISKCIVLCKNCHYELHWSEQHES